MKKYYRSVLMLAVIMMASIPSYAQANTVSVSLPKFEVEVLGEKIDNSYKEHPVIVYNNVTYFPLTYSDSRRLGLETTWSSEAGLGIKGTGVYSEYHSANRQTKNLESYKASVASFDIRINEQVVDNNTLTYPLLLFRDITYVPMTWDFAIDMFDLTLDFSEDYGLRINRSGATPTNLEIEDLGELKDTKENDFFGITYGRGYLYYIKNIERGYSINRKDLNTEEEKEIYRYREEINMSDVGSTYDDSEVVVLSAAYSMEHDYTGPVFPPEFIKKEDKIYFSYHTGGASMGDTHIFSINELGECTEVKGGNYFDFYETGNTIIYASYHMPPSTNNLSFERNGIRNYELSLNPLLYGWYKKEDGSGYSFDYNGLKISDGYLYLRASDYENKKFYNRLYRVDLETFQKEEVSDKSILDFEVENNTPYILTSGSSVVYKLGENATKITSTGTREFKVLGSTVCFLSNGSENVLHIVTEKLDELGNETLREYKPIKNFKGTNLYKAGNYVACTSDVDANYGMVVIDKNGDVVFRTTQLVKQVSGDENTIIYVTKDGEVFRLDLGL